MTTTLPLQKERLFRLLLLTALIAALVLVSGCGRLGLNRLTGNGERVEFGDTRFRAKVEMDREDRRNFSVSVRPAAIDLANAIEAGRFEANKYCIRGYGSSDIAWTAGPDRAVEDIQIVDDTLTLAGRCVQR